MKLPLASCVCWPRRRRGEDSVGVSTAAVPTANGGGGGGVFPTGGRGVGIGACSGGSVDGSGGGFAADGRPAVASASYPGATTLSTSSTVPLCLPGGGPVPLCESDRGGYAAAATSGRHQSAGDERWETLPDPGGPDVASDEAVEMVGFPIVSFTVVSCSSLTRSLGRRTVVHACLGRNLYLRWAVPGDMAPVSLDVFLSERSQCVRLGREGGELRVAVSSDLRGAAAVDYDCLHGRLLFVRGDEQSAAPGGGTLSVIELVLEAPSADVCRAWAVAGDSLVLPWPLLLSLGRAGGNGRAVVVQALQGWTSLPPVSTSKRGAMSAALGARGRRAILQASHWLQPLMNDGAYSALDLADQILGMPVAGAVLRVALLVVQSTALAVLANAHRTMRVAVLKRSADLAGRLVVLVDEALTRDLTAFATAHAAQLCGVLGRVEAVLNAVEATFFVRPAKTALEERVVRGWTEQLEVLDSELMNMCALGAVGYGFDWMAARVSAMERLDPSSADHGSRTSGGDGSDTSVYDMRWRPPPLDAGYVPGVNNPERAEHAIVAALQAPLVGVAGTASRIGVCAVGGSGKTTALAGVVACDYVRARFTKGTAWVHLNASSTLQTVAEAAMALVYRFCGVAAVKQLSALTTEADFVAVAAGYVRSVPVADAALWMVVIDNVQYKKRELLRQLLALIPAATPVLFSTRSEAVVASVPGATLVSIDALPVDDARLVLAVAAGVAVVAGEIPFSTTEEVGWVRRVLIKTECHALSLAIVGSMIGVRGGAWQAVVEALEHRWMDPDFWCSDSDSPRPSVRATLDVSLGLLPDGVCREAFAAMGVLPTYAPLPVLARLWQTSLIGAAAADWRSAAQPNSLSSSRVEQLVDALVRAGLLRRDVDKSSGKLVGVFIHPVVGQYALSLLGDAVRATHQRMVDSYMGGVAVDGLDVHAWRQLPLWEVPDDGYWYDHVVRHLAAAGDVCGLVSAMDSAWRSARVRVSSPLAFQADMEVVLSALTVVAGGTTPEAVRSPVLLGRVHAALALTHAVRITGSRRTNMEAAIVHWDRALVLVTKLDAPALWADLQAGCGRAYRVRVDGSRAANIEETIACYQRALEVRTREAVPLKWAETQSNLGAAHVDRVAGDKATNVEAAIECYKGALTVRTRAAAPLEWASTQNSLGAAYSRRFHGDKAANVEAAITCYDEALTVYTRSAAPLWWARIRYNLGIAYYDRLVGDKAATIEAAIACYNDALTVRTREAAPLQWAATQHHLGKAHRDRLFGDRASNVAAAVACFDRALTVRTRAAVPLNWAETQYQIGVMHHGRYEGSATAAVDLDAAVACYRLALEVRTSEAAPQEWALTSFSLLMAFVDGERWSAAVECGRALERFGPRWAAWPAQQAAVTSAIAEARRVLA